MKFLIFLLFILTCSSTWADEVKIEIDPKKPVVGEVFRAYVRIFTESDAEPVINFVPSAVEVVGKSNQGISTRTVYANGNLTVTREMTFVYELVGSRAGSASLRDINVQLGRQNLRHPSLNFTVLAEREEKADVFLVVDLPKKDVYIGEGIIARYYVYSKNNVSIRGIETKKYPKLNNFLKRFLQEPENPERVSADGEVFVRRLVYSAKLFPEKAGELKIDSLHATVTAAIVNANDPFGAFGLARDFRNKSITSEVVTLNVKPLPEPVPANFTGLVGKHDFDLSFNQAKLIVNEPLEAKLTVSGGGMLESMEAPVLISHPGFEDFENNGDLKIADANMATKTFEYTYLAKSNLTIPASSLALTYLDPQSGRYIATNLSIPELVVAGGKASDKPEVQSKTSTKDEPSQKTSLPLTPKDFSGPLYSSKISQLLPYLNLSLAILALILAGSWFWKSDYAWKTKNPVEIPGQFKKGQFSFGEFARWLSPLIQKTGKAPLAIIKDSDLDQEAKSYFIELLNANDYKVYSTGKGEAKFDYKAGYFKSLSKYIASATHESASKSS